jgi:integrase
MQAQRHASLFAGEVQQSLAAALLFTPRECSRPERDVMTLEEVKKACKALPLRERLIVKLAVLAGMRPGEIFGLRRGHVGESYASVSQRVYRGDIDTPKTVKSLRKVALPEGLRQDLKTWLATSPDSGPQNPSTSMARSNRGENQHRAGLLRQSESVPSLLPAGTGFYVQRSTIWKQIGDAISGSMARP